MEYLLIDGYNIINSWNDIFDMEKDSLEECRDKLLAMLSNYQGFKNIKVIAVFDAHMVKGSQQKHGTYDNLTVVFTKENETADNYIERFVFRLGSQHVIGVATSDYLEQRLVLSKGGVRISPRELRQEIDSAGRNARFTTVQNLDKSNSIMSRVDSEVFDKLDRIRRGKV